MTSQLFQGNLGGLAGADEKCQALTDAASLDGEFRAWLSDADTPITARFQPSQGRYVRLDGVVIANNWSELGLDSTLRERISVDETGATASGSVTPSTSPYAWTGQGVEPNGNVSYCADWTSSSTDESGLMGNFTRTDAWQSLGAAADCVIDLHLYCFEVL